VEFLRQLDLVAPAALETPVHLIGCGGIGSFAALALGKLGCTRLHLYDDDRVEEHNLPNQLFRTSDVGRHKATALAEIVEVFTGVRPEACLRRVEADRLQGILVSGVDSMSARKTIWRRSIRYRAGIPLYLDGRLGAETCRVYAVRPADPRTFAATSRACTPMARRRPCRAPRARSSTRASRWRPCWPTR
jgi:molybdopterin/thiamine biosynthesis adenylyltransferase